MEIRERDRGHIYNWRDANLHVKTNIQKKSIIIPFESSLSWCPTECCCFFFLFFCNSSDVFLCENGLQFMYLVCNCGAFVVCHPYFVIYFIFGFFRFGLCECIIIFVFCLFPSLLKSKCLKQYNACIYTSTPITCISSHPQHDCRCLCNFNMHNNSCFAYNRLHHVTSIYRVDSISFQSFQRKRENKEKYNKHEHVLHSLTI